MQASMFSSYKSEVGSLMASAILPHIMISSAASNRLVTGLRMRFTFRRFCAYAFSSHSHTGNTMSAASVVKLVGYM